MMTCKRFIYHDKKIREPPNYGAPEPLRQRSEAGALVGVDDNPAQPIPASPPKGVPPLRGGAKRRSLRV